MKKCILILMCGCMLLLAACKNEGTQNIEPIIEVIDYGEAVSESNHQTEAENIEKDWNELPDLIVHNNGVELDYVGAVVTGDEVLNDAENVFDTYYDTHGQDIIYMDLGQMIQLEFLEESPDYINIREVLLTSEGMRKYEEGADINTPIIEQASRGVYSFLVSENFNVGLSTDANDYLYGNVYRGYLINCSWEDGTYEAEYGLIIRTDANYDRRKLDRMNDTFKQANMLVNRLAYAINTRDAELMLELGPYLDTDADELSEFETILEDIYIYTEGQPIVEIMHQVGDFVESASVVYYYVDASGKNIYLSFDPEEENNPLFEIIIRRSNSSHRLMDAYVEALKDEDADAISQLTFVDGHVGKYYDQEWINLVFERYENEFDLESLDWEFLGTFSEGGVYDCIITGTKDGVAVSHPISFGRFYENLSVIDTYFTSVDYFVDVSLLEANDFIIQTNEGVLECHVMVEDFALNGMFGDILFEDERTLQGDGFTGSRIKTVTYEQGVIEYFSVTGEAYWTLSVELTGDAIETYRGMTIGTDLEDLWTYYNVNDFNYDYEGGYYGHDLEGYNTIYFGVVDDLVTSIRYDYWMD